MRKVVSEQVYDHNDVSRMQSERCAKSCHGQYLPAHGNVAAPALEQVQRHRVCSASWK